MTGRIGGAGGRSLNSTDQGNLTLARSSIEGLTVRVVRGVNLESPYAPRGGYRYDGLYLIDDY
jgi:putative restriction endonuclease